MIKTATYIFFYTLIYLAPVFLINVYSVNEVWFVISYLALFLFAFIFRPNMLRIALLWLLIQALLFIDTYYHSHYISSPQSLNLTQNFNWQLLLITLFPILPLIVAYCTYFITNLLKTKKSS